MKKKKTGGGRFDPSDSPIYFIAGNVRIKKHHYSLLATNDLMSDNAGTGMQEALAERMADPSHRMLLDSGIFWLTNKHKREHAGMTMDEALSLPPGAIDGFDELYAMYTSLIDEHEDNLWGYVELDQGGAENKRITRAKLEASGYRPIPVYHPLNDGWDYFDELCQQYDRICCGNVVQANAADRKKILHTLWERHRQYPDVWIHLLGLTPNELSTIYPPNSADSATYCYSLVYGASTTPFATSMQDSFSRLDSTYSYLPNVDQTQPGGLKNAIDFLDAHAIFGLQSWRNQQADLEELFEQPALPAFDKRENALIR